MKMQFLKISVDGLKMAINTLQQLGIEENTLKNFIDLLISYGENGEIKTPDSKDYKANLAFMAVKPLIDTGIEHTAKKSNLSTLKGGKVEPKKEDFTKFCNDIGRNDLIARYDEILVKFQQGNITNWKSYILSIKDTKQTHSNNINIDKYLA